MAVGFWHKVIGHLERQYLQLPILHQIRRGFRRQEFGDFIFRHVRLVERIFLNNFLHFRQAARFGNDDAAVARFFAAG